ncbi:MAG: hypothetical protein IPI97_14735 [Nitrosomonas sp.]|nr:hypothetical protein [Nitrosomonas sp.]
MFTENINSNNKTPFVELGWLKIEMVQINSLSVYESPFPVKSVTDSKRLPKEKRLPIWQKFVTDSVTKRLLSRFGN